METTATKHFAEEKTLELRFGPDGRAANSTLTMAEGLEGQGETRLVAGPVRHGSVLLVEEYGDLREVLVEVLEANGFGVTAYSSARDALAATVQEVDVVLVGVNGYEREQDDDLAQLQRNWRWAEVPIIALATGDGGLRVSGVARVLHKPVGVDALCSAIRLLLCQPAQVDG